MTLTQDDFKSFDFDPRIDISFEDGDNPTLTIKDSGIGMSKKAVFILSYGIQKVLGNSSTDIGDNPEASVQSKFFENLGLESLYKYTNYRNQTNTLLGFGIDYKINDNVYLFLRSTKYRYFDPNFIENHLKGFETMLELKINF